MFEKINGNVEELAVEMGQFGNEPIGGGVTPVALVLMQATIIACIKSIMALPNAGDEAKVLGAQNIVLNLIANQLMAAQGVDTMEDALKDPSTVDKIEKDMHRAVEITVAAIRSGMMKCRPMGGEGSEAETMTEAEAMVAALKKTNSTFGEAI